MQVIRQFCTPVLQCEHISALYSAGSAASMCFFFSPNVFYIVLGTRIFGYGSEARSYN